MRPCRRRRNEPGSMPLPAVRRSRSTGRRPRRDRPARSTRPRRATASTERSCGSARALPGRAPIRLHAIARSTIQWIGGEGCSANRSRSSSTNRSASSRSPRAAVAGRAAPGRDRGSADRAPPGRRRARRSMFASASSSFPRASSIHARTIDTSNSRSRASGRACAAVESGRERERVVPATAPVVLVHVLGLVPGDPRRVAEAHREGASLRVRGERRPEGRRAVPSIAPRL